MGSVRLLAVSKTFPLEAVQALHGLGQIDFGENYVQEARTKAPLVTTACWHLIGPLQKNKINQALEMFEVFHSLDSFELIRALSSRAERAGRKVRGLIQIHQGEEDSKFGLSAHELLPMLERLRSEPLPNLELVGLMSVPPPPEAPDFNRHHFRALRELLEQARPLLDGAELSMGMSEDFPAAIAEGATWIRIGRALFGHRDLRPH